MRFRRLCPVAALLALAPFALVAQQPGMPEVPQLVVAGYGQIAVPPDRATIDVAVETRAPTAAAAASRNARRVREVLDTLRARGVAASDVATVAYAVQPEYASSGRGQPTLRGYVANNVVRVETAAMDPVGALIDAALAAGADRINDVRFRSSRYTSLRDSATAIAVSNARRTAEAMARASGGQLGALLEVRGELPPTYGGGYGGGLGTLQLQAAVTSIAPSDQTVYASVVTRWRIEAGR